MIYHISTSILIFLKLPCVAATEGDAPSVRHPRVELIEDDQHSQNMRLVAKEGEVSVKPNNTPSESRRDTGRALEDHQGPAVRWFRL